MSEIELDAGVFIRSMASRGSLGGLSRCATEAADVLDAAGKEIILLETVGVGQSELDIARAADTTIVVLVPESGDAIQAMKAGLMEIADVFVMNKADRAGADSAVQSLQTILGLRHGPGPTPEVCTCVAQEGRGVAELAVAVRAHRALLEQSGALLSRRQARLEERIADLIVGRVRRQFWTPERRAALARRTTEVLRGTGTPYDVVEELTQSFRLSNEE
jgi:LAO/AO transport system kinase